MNQILRTSKWSSLVRSNKVIPGRLEKSKRSLMSGVKLNLVTTIGS